MLIRDPFFAWLRPMSALIVQIDEFVMSKEPTDPADGRALLAQARALLTPDDPATTSPARVATAPSRSRPRSRCSTANGGAGARRSQVRPEHEPLVRRRIFTILSFASLILFAAAMECGGEATRRPTWSGSSTAEDT